MGYIKGSFAVSFVYGFVHICIDMVNYYDGEDLLDGFIFMFLCPIAGACVTSGVYLMLTGKIVYSKSFFWLTVILGFLFLLEADLQTFLIYHW